MEGAEWMELSKWIRFSDGPRTMNKFRGRNAQGITQDIVGRSACRKQRAHIWKENNNKNEYLFGSIMHQAIAKYFT